MKRTAQVSKQGFEKKLYESLNGLSEEQALMFLTEANRISQGDEHIVYEIIAYLRSKRGVGGLKKYSLTQSFYELNLRRRNSGNHLSADSHGKPIDNERMLRHSSLQVNKLFKTPPDKFSMRDLISRILAQDYKWIEDRRHDDSKYSLLVRIWENSLSFNTTELNQLCEEIRKVLNTNRQAWLPVLQRLESGHVEVGKKRRK